VAQCPLAGFTSGAHGEFGARGAAVCARGADGVVLDLRDNGGGLLNEAVLVSSIFVPDGKIVSTRGRSRPRARLRGHGRAIDEDDPGRGPRQ
jgi:carboxyl-terminal processing protease